MTLRQLRYLCEVVRCRFNISTAARSLGASQPAVSQQLRLLEDELGTTLLQRGGNRLIGLTRKGEEIVASAQGVLADITMLKTLAEVPSQPDAPLVRVVSTYAQARYGLPAAISRFKQRFPQATVHIVPRSDENMWQPVHDGRADLAIATNPGDLPGTLIKLPCTQIRRILIAPRGHPLLRFKVLSLEVIARYPLITTDEHFPGPRRIMRALKSAGVAPRIDVTATNEDIVKACVEAGLGVAILSSPVFDPRRDNKLGAKDVTALLEPSITSVVVRRKALRIEHLSHFIHCFAPIWTPAALSRAVYGE